MNVRRYSLIAWIVSLCGHAASLGTGLFLANRARLVGTPGLHEVELLESTQTTTVEPAKLHFHRVARVVDKQRIARTDEESEEKADDVAPPQAVGRVVYGDQEVDVPARLRAQPKLRYPAAEYRDGVEGEVVLFLEVDDKGEVVRAEISESSGEAFGPPALDAVRASRFFPAEKGGRPVSVHVHWTIKFRIE